MSKDINGAARRLGRARNIIQSVLVMAAMVALLAAVGGLFGGPMWMIVLLVIGLPFLALGPSVGSRVLMRMQGAVPLSAQAAPRIADLLVRLARGARLPAVPQLYLVPSPAITAYTTGTRDSAAIAVTDGLLRALTFRELAGVLAHEVSHVQRNDVWMIGLTNVLGRATHFMSVLGQFLLFLNLPLMLMGRFTMPWSAILLLVFAPTLSLLLQLALSRTREYQADAGAVQLTGDPGGLASALAKLEQMNAGFLEHFTLRRRGDQGTSLFRTHPLTRHRIERLAQLSLDLGEGRAIA